MIQKYIDRLLLSGATPSEISEHIGAKTCAPGWVSAKVIGVDTVFTYPEYRVASVSNPRGSFTKEQYIVANDEKKDRMAAEVFNTFKAFRDHGGLIRGPFGFKELKKAMDGCRTYAEGRPITGTIISASPPVGNDICTWLNPEVWKASAGGKPSMYDRFYSDEMLARAIKNGLRYVSKYSGFSLSNVRDWLIQTFGQAPTNFKPSLAAALYERYSPPGGVVLDYSAGFGGRLFGALSVGRRYIGIDPNPDTMKGNDRIGREMCRVLGVDPSDRYVLYTQGSEQKLSEYDFSDYCDFVFSSPPYFNLEKYTDHPGQGHDGRNIDQWFSEYVVPTIRNCFNYTKLGGFYGVNIADYAGVQYVARWIEEVKNAGFVEVEALQFDLQSRRGTGHNNGNTRHKLEGIFIFQKPIKGV